MRVTFLNPSGQLGGAERSLLDVLASLRKEQPDWSLSVVVADAGPLVAQVEALGVEVVVLPFPASVMRLGDAVVGGLTLARRLLAASPAVLSYVIRLRRVVRALAPDVVHTNGFKMHLLGAWATPRPTPVIWHVRDYVSNRPVMARLLRRNANRVSAVVANSESVARDVQATCGAGLPVQTVYNAIDLVNFAPTGPTADLDQLAGLPPAPPGTIRVGLLATLSPWKGHEVFLEALSRVPRNLPVRGYVVAGALYKTESRQLSVESLGRLAERLGISDRVGMTGFVHDPAAAMRWLDIVVHASTHPEPFGRVIAEAMACGRAAIVSEAGGAAELITAGENALGHPPGDADVLAECIERLVVDPELRTALGRAGRVTAEIRFDRARLALELIPLYRGAVAARNQRRPAKLRWLRLRNFGVGEN